ncbi:DUF6875 domain-containing protein [Rhodococcus sp. UFZ-B548]|uniref:DUF6875 domain-containing protein n=1 Tax=Rhodococcus sp. UFZ-B548 TaxID=2742212 RepID=UPI0037C8EE34
MPENCCIPNNLTTPCDVPGLWNPEFRPQDAPFPMLAVRHMVASDFPFLRADPDWLQAYLDQFATEIPLRTRREIARNILSAEAA